MLRLRSARPGAPRRAIAGRKLASRAAQAAGETERFQAQLAQLRERNRHRPAFMAMLQKAALG